MDNLVDMVNQLLVTIDDAIPLNTPSLLSPFHVQKCDLELWQAF